MKDFERLETVGKSLLRWCGNSRCIKAGSTHTSSGTKVVQCGWSEAEKHLLEETQLRTRSQSLKGCVEVSELDCQC